jgi:myo-inositol 2-dehydrogenase/D-chiro-inositol 1-dehydrogenase
MPKSQDSVASRRSFLKKTSVSVAAGLSVARLSVSHAAHPFGDDTIRIGLVGCGGRGTGAAAQAMNTSGPTRLVAVADVFESRLNDCVDYLGRDHADKLDVPPERRFVGLDAYQGVMASDADLIILTTPPGFRPLHFEAAIAADKHVFMEKPVAVDAPGIRRVQATGHVAREKNLAVAVGIQRRHEDRYKETVKRIQDGMIGDIIASRVYWNSDGVWVRPRKPGQTEMEYQLQNWYYFNWLCGDHIVEQHIHNLDVGNWVKNAFPVSAAGMGGRLVRRGIDHGQIFDHHCVEFTFDDGSKMFSQCRHMPGTQSNVSEFVHGSKGSASVSGAQLYNERGDTIWQYGDGGGGGHQQEHHDLFALLRNGEVPNETEYGAMSTMTAILGRMATYSGKVISMEQALAQGKLIAPVDHFDSFDDLPPVRPDGDGRYPVPVPGVTQVLDDPQEKTA